MLQERRSVPPRYRVVRESGPEHQKLFTIELQIDGEVFAQAEGSTKKAAEQTAARIALNRLREAKVEQ
jgi:ribonuclease-3